MSLKKRLVATIASMCLVIALLMVGIWAVRKAEFEFAGTISFKATNVNAIISGSITGAEGGTVIPSALVYSSKEEPTLDQLSSWNKSLAFTEDAADIVITLNVQNKSPERDLYISIKDTVGTTISTLDKSIQCEGKHYSDGAQVKVEKNTTKTFTITFHINDEDLSADSSYGYLVTLNDQSLIDDGLEATISTGSNSTEYSKEDGETSAVHTFTTTAQAVSASTPAKTDYTITNNSTTEAMIVEPNFVATEDAEASVYEVEAQAASANITSKVYFSFDQGATFSMLVEKYITVPAGSSVVVRVQVEATIDTTYSATLNLGLYTQVSCPSDYTNSYTYSIVDGKGYKTAEGTTTAVAMAEDEYIIVTPETVQSVLDRQAISNKVIIFAEGTYDDMYIRPGYNSETKAYSWNADRTVVEANEVDLETVITEENKTTAYIYHRIIRNVTFAGTEKAKFVGRIEILNSNTNVYDGVKEATKAESASHFDHMYVDGIEFTDMKFTYVDENDNTPGRIYIHYTEYAQKDVDRISKLIVKNCQFKAYKNSEGKYLIKDKSIQAVYVGSTSLVEPLEDIFVRDIKIKNNNVEGYYLGFKVANFDNLEIIGNSIKNTEHNAFAVQSQDSDSPNYFTGVVKIYNNVVDGCLATAKDPAEEIGERAIRVGKGKDTEIYIENNSFANCGQYAPGDTEAELLKTISITNGSLYFLNNTYVGKDIETVSYDKGDYTSPIIITRAV